MSSKIKIKVTDVLSMLQEGKTREDIRVHYGINKTELKALFQHPELKGRKTIKPKELSFVIVDDIKETSGEDVAEVEFEISSEKIQEENSVSEETTEEVQEETQDEVEPTTSTWEN